MGLPRNSIQKLLRESFPGSVPLFVAPADRQALAADLAARLARLDGVDTKDHGWSREEDKPRHVLAFSIADAQHQHYYSRDSFRLMLDEANRLTIEESHYHRGPSVLVSSLDEVVAFVRACKERLERRRAQAAKRGKVRDLLTQAILAQVRKVARAERFDYMSETDSQKLKLYVRLSDQHALELSIPFSNFKEVLPQLRSVICSLRELYQAGIRFHIVARQGLPWRKNWVKHDGPQDEG